MFKLWQINNGNTVLLISVRSLLYNHLLMTVLLLIKSVIGWEYEMS